MTPETHPLIERVRKAGCFAVGLYAFAIFFGIGGVLALINVDFLLALQGLLLAAAMLGIGIWLAHKHVR